VAQILPTLAVAADPDTLTYTQVPLSDLYSDALPSQPHTSQAPRSSLFSLSLGLRSMLSQLLSLRTRYKALALFRGLGVFAIISIFEALTAALSIYLLPSLLTTVPQILLPLTLVQLYAIWTHTVLTYPSAKSLWLRIPPFKATLCATGPALAVFLAAKALLKFALVSLYGIELRQRGQSYPPFPVALVLTVAGVLVVALVPAHMILTRIQASLLPADEKTIVSVDKALRGDRNGREMEAVSMKEAWTTFGWGAWGRLGVLYAQIFVVVLFGGGAVLAVDFLFFIWVSLLVR
jgi:hypothetical protein